MKVFVNNKEYSAEPEDTIIELCDKIGVHIPRFCYHKHLSVVASCRMCLVDIEGVKYWKNRSDEQGTAFSACVVIIIIIVIIFIRPTFV